MGGAHVTDACQMSVCIFLLGGVASMKVVGYKLFKRMWFFDHKYMI